jgi:hypothetical protein
MVYRSITTVKADAARRSYDAFGEGITWAVVDSGIDGRHLHFRTRDNLGGDVAELHRDFTGGYEQSPEALKDRIWARQPRSGDHRRRPTGGATQGQEAQHRHQGPGRARQPSVGGAERLGGAR